MKHSPPKIKTVIFDLDGVLIRSLPNTTDLLTSVLPYPAATIDSQYYGPEFLALMLGRIFEKDFWQTVSHRHGWNLAPEVPMRLVRQSWQEIDGVRSQIVDLRRGGYRLGLLSNHVREWVGELEKQFAYEALFDDIVYSYQIGMVKPDRSIYIQALQRLNAQPEETLFVDDRPRNLLTAHELGFQVRQFIAPDQLRQDLRRLLF